MKICIFKKLILAATWRMDRKPDGGQAGRQEMMVALDQGWGSGVEVLLGGRFHRMQCGWCPLGLGDPG